VALSTASRTVLECESRAMTDLPARLIQRDRYGDETVDKVELVWSSAPLEYDHVMLEVLLDHDPVVIVNREKGLNNLEVELFGPTPKGTMLYKLPLDRRIGASIEFRHEMKESRWKDEPDIESDV
jgi:hypothetical protein